MGGKKKGKKGGGKKKGKGGVDDDTKQEMKRIIDEIHTSAIEDVPMK